MTDLHKAVLANLDTLSDDAAAHIFPSDLQKCMTSECTVKVASVRMGNPDERSVPLFSRDQVDAALREALAAPVVQPGAYRVYKDGSAWCAVPGEFVNLQESLSGFGDSPMAALGELVVAQADADFVERRKVRRWHCNNCQKDFERKWEGDHAPCPSCKAGAQYTIAAAPKPEEQT